LSTWRWAIVIVIPASVILGITRGVRNGSALNANLSAFIPLAFIPLYGLVYFLAAKGRAAVDHPPAEA